MRLKIFVFFLALIFTVVTVPVPVFSEGRSIKLDVKIRDFKSDGKLFEGVVADMEKLVRPQLGSDRKPIFSDPKNPTWPIPLWQTWGEQSPVSLYELEALFNDVVGRNLLTGQQLTLTEDKDGFFSVDMRSITNKTGYFPIDGQMYGNEGKEHNYHFTMEQHSNFIYKGSESFTIAGDDDIWVFINGRLVIDMGGVHSGSQRTISLPELVKDGTLKMKKGDYIPFDLFFMERHTSQSNLYIKTNIGLIEYKTSAWALAELDKADQFDLIPPSLKYADMTRNITREEFAELVVRLYDKMSEDAIFPVNPNPFTDTKNPEILKALKLGITTGTSSTKFSPNELINREQVASMLSRTIRILRPEGDYSTAGAPTFKDQKDISAWALEHALFVSKNGILMGTDGKFMPKAVTSAQKAAGYANTTREQAIAMCVRIFIKYK